MKRSGAELAGPGVGLDLALPGRRSRGKGRPARHGDDPCPPPGHAQDVSFLGRTRSLGAARKEARSASVSPLADRARSCCPAFIDLDQNQIPWRSLGGRLAVFAGARHETIGVRVGAIASVRARTLQLGRQR